MAPEVAIPYEVYREQEALKAREEAARLKMDQSVPGGIFELNGVLVDCNGIALKDQGEVKKGDEVFSPRGGDAPVADDYDNMTAKELRTEAEARGLQVSGTASKEELATALRGSRS